jgi:hypothetical protein
MSLTIELISTSHEFTSYNCFLDLLELNENCYNHSRRIEYELYYNTLKVEDIEPIENCFGWTYFESLFIIGIVQIVLSILGLTLAIYILIAIIKLNPMKILREMNSQKSSSELTSTSNDQNGNADADMPI